MRCPVCHSTDTKILETRTSKETEVRRRRRCAACQSAFYTTESLETDPLIVVSRHGPRESFDRTRIESSLRSATQSRWPKTQIESTARSVVERLHGIGPVVRSQEIGEAILDELQRADPGGALRFFIQLRRPKSIAEVRDWLEAQVATRGDSPERFMWIERADGRRELFDKEKVLDALRDATHGSDVLDEREISNIVNAVESDLHAKIKKDNARKLTPQDITDCIAGYLLGKDNVSYLNYIMSHRKLNDYLNLLATLNEVERNGENSVATAT